MSPLLTIGLAMLAGLLAGLTLVFRRQEAATARRLRRLARVAGPRLETSLSLEGAASATPQRDAAMSQWWPRAEAVKRRLAQSGTGMSLGQYGTLVTALAAVALAAGLAFGGTLVGVVAALVAMLLPGRWLIRRAAKRQRAFMDQFPDAIDLVVRALGAGLPLAVALGTVGDEFPDPAGAEFRHVRAALSLGQSVESALWEMVARVDVPELRFFTISVATQQQTGGNLAETLINLNDMLRARMRMRLKIRAMTGEARASAWVLGALPFMIGLLMAVVNPSYLMPLIADERGWMMIGGGVVMLTMGVGTMSALISFEV